MAGAVLAAEPTDSSYIEASYVFPQISFSGLSSNQNQLVARGSYNFNRNFGVEAMAAAGISTGNINGVTLKVDSAYGTYLKAQFEAAPHFELYARAGYAHITLSSWATGSETTRRARGGNDPLSVSGPYGRLLRPDK